MRLRAEACAGHVGIEVLDSVMVHGLESESLGSGITYWFFFCNRKFHIPYEEPLKLGLGFGISEAMLTSGGKAGLL